MSDSMRLALAILVKKLGDNYGRIRWSWLMQKYDVMPWNECPKAMMAEV